MGSLAEVCAAAATTHHTKRLVARMHARPHADGVILTATGGRMRIAVRITILFAILAIVSPPLASAQAVGAVTGVVSDSSGAIIPGVTIEVTNVATAQTRVAVTGTDGFYSVLQLPPGPYQVK